jgi:hypothetical protein
MEIHELVIEMKLLERRLMLYEEKYGIWYDDFPHPNDASLAITFPHHKHVPPNIKRHRVPAPTMSFCRPNLPQIIEEIESLISKLD